MINVNTFQIFVKAGAAGNRQAVDRGLKARVYGDMGLILKIREGDFCNESEEAVMAKRLELVWPGQGVGVCRAESCKDSGGAALWGLRPVRCKTCEL